MFLNVDLIIQVHGIIRCPVKGQALRSLMYLEEEKQNKKQMETVLTRSCDEYHEQYFGNGHLQVHVQKQSDDDNKITQQNRDQSTEPCATEMLRCRREWCGATTNDQTDRNEQGSRSLSRHLQWPI